METLKYTCLPSFSSMHCMVCKFEKLSSSYRAFLLTVVMETMEYTCTQSFISMCTIVGKFEKWRSDFKENCLRLSVAGGCHGNQLSVMGNMYYVCVLSFIPICATINLLQFTKKHCPRLFVVVYKHVCCRFSFRWLNNLCIQSHVHIALTTCELHCPMCPHYNV